MESRECEYSNEHNVKAYLVLLIYTFINVLSGRYAAASWMTSAILREDTDRQCSTSVNESTRCNRSDQLEGVDHSQTLNKPTSYIV